MTEPVFSVGTEGAYTAMPTIYRTQDRLQQIPADGYPLKRWLSSVGDQLGGIFDLIDRFDFAPDDELEFAFQTTSDLVDPLVADAAWLPWLAQLVGVNSAGMDEMTLRDAVSAATSGFRGGTKRAVAAAVRSVLTGEKSVAIYDHSVSSPGDGGGEWDLLVITRGSESPDSAAVIAAANTAKPAGVIVHHSAVDVTWATLATDRPTWAAWNNATWTEIAETGI